MTKPKLTAEERRIRQTDQIMRIRFRVMIGRELDELGASTPDAIGAALGMPAATRHRHAISQFQSADRQACRVAPDYWTIVQELQGC
jgi:hypothetical protein